MGQLDDSIKEFALRKLTDDLEHTNLSCAGCQKGIPYSNTTQKVSSHKDPDGDHYKLDIFCITCKELVSSVVVWNHEKTKLQQAIGNK